MLGVLAATLVPGSGAPAPERCLFCADAASADAILNVGLFLPLGAMLVANGWKPGRALLSACLLSIAVESSQLFIPGRDASLTDILANGTGAALGILAARTAPFWLHPPPRRALRLAAAGAAASVLVLALTQVLLRPSLPRSQYFGQWTARFGNMAEYAGRVQSVELAGRSLPSRDLGSSDSVRADLLGGRTLRIRALAGPRTDRLAPIFSIADEHQRMVLLLGADRGDLVLRWRARAATLRLEQPELRVPGALGVEPGSPLDLAVEHIGPGACLVVNTRRACPGFGPLMGWSLLASSPWLAARERAGAQVLWCALLLLPSCYWGTRAARRAR